MLKAVPNNKSKADSLEIMSSSDQERGHQEYYKEVLLSEIYTLGHAFGSTIYLGSVQL